MLRRLFRYMSIVLLALSGPAAAAPDDAASIAAAMRIPDVFAVMAEEGQDYGASLEDEMFPGAGGAAWQAAVRSIYATDRTLPVFRAAFATGLAADDDQTGAMAAFFASELGRRVTTLEISARRALLDEAVEDASRLKLEELRAQDDPRLDLVEEFIAANNLVEENVSSGLNASYAFYLGLQDAGVLGPEMNDSDIIAEVWAREDQIRGDTGTWIRSYLIMAYAPLTDAELRDYIAFSRTGSGQALNRALFAGFDAVFVDVSRKLGRAAGVVLAGQKL